MSRNFKAILAVAAVSITGACAGYGAGGQSGANRGSQVLVVVAPPTERCAALANMTLENAQVTSAELIADGAEVPGATVPDFAAMGAGGPLKGMPEFCRVVGKSRPEPGSDINFEVWLPSSGWNGRFLSAGNGGFAGYINYPEMASALASGHATANSDTGHTGNPQAGDWARDNPVAVRDYGWRAVHETTVAAKALLRSFYGRPQDKAYFSSCSNGGRQALMEASRFPEDYDGIIAGAPAAPFSKLLLAMAWSQQAQMPKGAAISSKQVKFIEAEVIRQCDTADGVKDGLVDDPRQCRFDFARFSCARSKSEQCLSAPQVKALRKIHAGPTDSKGRPVARPYLLSGGEAGSPVPFMGWENWVVARDSVSPLGRPANAIYPESLLRDFVDEPFATVETFDWDKHPALVAERIGKDLDPAPTLKPFFDRGGKLIIWHGWADAAIPALGAIDYYNDALRLGGANASESMRLFLIPGMQHCVGGLGAGSFGQMAAPKPSDVADRHLGMAMRNWVEGGRAPDAVVGTTGFAFPGVPQAGPVRERLHCAWPKQAKLAPGADPDKASSYTCR